MERIKELLNEREGRLVTVTARPGVGKSAFLKNILNLVDCRVLYFDLEGNTNSVVIKLDNIGINNEPIIISEPNISISEIEETIRRTQGEKNLKVVMIDYLQLINNPYNEDILNVLNSLARQYSINIIIASELSPIEGNITVPVVLDHLRNKNKSILQYSDSILLLTSDGSYEDNIVNVKIQTIKDTITPIFVEEVKLDKEKGLFYNE